MGVELFVEHDFEHVLGHAEAAVDVVVAVHQHFRLDDRHDLRFLAERGIARQRVRIGLDAVAARDALADVDHAAPFGEARALLVIFRQPVGQSVEADGDEFAGAERQRLGAFVHLDAVDRTGLFDQLDQRRAVFALLPDRLVIEDDARDVLHAFGRAEQHLAIVAACVLGRLDADGVETLLDGAGGFVGRQNAFAGRDHGQRHFVQFIEIHIFLHPIRHFCRNTSTPGKGLPSSHSRKAPPAVETYVNRSTTPATLSAATVSPPPATVTSLPAAVSSAAASATSTVPLSNGSISKAPNGPFQTSVFERASTEITCSTLRGPMSRIISFSPTRSISTTREGASASNFSATTTSTGSTSSRLAILASSMILRAVSTRSRSASDFPMFFPCASKNVLAMAPPMISTSTFCSRWPSRSSLVEILAPPTMAVSGRAGLSSTFSKPSSSACKVRPA